MGRPFIVYSSDDEEDSCHHSHAGTASTSGRDWTESAVACLEDAGYEDTEEVQAVLRFIYATRRTAYLPHAEPAILPLRLADTKIGGRPYLMPGEEWPSNTDRPLAFLWQFRVNELPRAVQQALGYYAGLLQVFIDEELDNDDRKWYMIRVLDESDIVARPPESVTVPLQVTMFEEQSVLRFRPVEDWPHMDDLLLAIPDSASWAGLARDVVEHLANHEMVSTVAGDKLLGWPNWCQGAEWRMAPDCTPFVQLMQLEGEIVNFMVGDSGTLLMQRHPHHRDEWEITWACC